MLLILIILCLYILALLAITLAVLAYLFREFTLQLLEHMLHSRNHPHKHTTTAWGDI